MDISEIEQRIGYTFKDKRLLERALTLPFHDNNFNNQTLEFLGDAVLEFIVSDRLYDESTSEGVLTERRRNIVSDAALAPVSLRLGLDGFLVGYEQGNKKAVPSAYEAMVAAIYRDGGISEAENFVLRTLDFSCETQIENFIGNLQEHLAKLGIKEPPVYETEDIGTKQKPWFKSTVTVFGREFSGDGESKPAAKQCAAQLALNYLQTRGNHD